MNSSISDVVVSHFLHKHETITVWGSKNVQFRVVAAVFTSLNFYDMCHWRDGVAS